MLGAGDRTDADALALAVGRVVEEEDDIATAEGVGRVGFMLDVAVVDAAVLIAVLVAPATPGLGRAF